jgi:hypothetical protein
MSDTIKDGGPAFPGQMPTGYDPRSGNYFEGMTLRDYFAAAALSGIMADPETGSEECFSEEDIMQSRRDTALAAYGYADAMLDARKAGAK